MAIRKLFPFFTIVLFFAIIPFSFANPETKKITLNFSPWAPFEYEEKRRPKGINLEIIKATFQRMGFDILFLQYPWKRAYEDAKKGSADGVFSMGKRAEREKDFIFPSEATINTGWFLYFPKGKVISFKKNLQGLKGLTIGTTLGYIYPPTFMKSSLFEREVVNTDLQNLNKLKKGRLDAIVCDDINCQLLIKKNNMENLFEMYTETPIDITPMYLGFSKKSKLLTQYPSLVKEFSTTLKQVKEEGTASKIARKYSIKYRK